MSSVPIISSSVFKYPSLKNYWPLDTDAVALTGSVDGIAVGVGFLTEKAKFGGAAEFTASVTSSKHIAFPTSSMNPYSSSGAITSWVYLETSSKFNITAGTSSFTSSTEIPSASWNFIVYTWNATTSSIYINGVLDASTPRALYSYVTRSNVDTLIGSCSDSSESYAGFRYKIVGSLDDLAYFNRELNKDEIYYLYTGPSAKESTQPIISSSLFTDVNLKSYWQLDSNSNSSTGSANGTDNNVSYINIGDNFGGYAKFNTTSSYIKVTGSAINPYSNTGTITSWIYLATSSKFSIACSGSILYSNAVISSSVWSLITYTWDATSSNIYINGELDTSSAETFHNKVSQSSADAYIGSGSQTITGSFRYIITGSIDDLAYFNRKLSSQEVYYLYSGMSLTKYYSISSITASFTQSSVLEVYDQHFGNSSITSSFYTLVMSPSITYYPDVKDIRPLFLTTGGNYQLISNSTSSINSVFTQSSILTDESTISVTINSYFTESVNLVRVFYAENSSSVIFETTSSLYERSICNITSSFDTGHVELKLYADSGGPIDNCTLLLLHANEGDGYHYTTESIQNRMLYVGISAATSTTGKFGAGGLLIIPGLNQYGYVTIPNANYSNLAFGSSNWTIDTWIQPYSTNIRGRYIYNDPGALLISYDLNTVTVQGQTVNASIPYGYWSHLAVQRSGSILQVFVNGVQQGANLTASNVPDSGVDKYISSPTIGTVVLSSYIDEFRISNCARYSGNFSTASGEYGAQPVTYATSSINSYVITYDKTWAQYRPNPEYTDGNISAQPIILQPDAVLDRTENYHSIFLRGNCPKFVIPESLTDVMLCYSILNPNWFDSNEVKHESVVNGNRNYVIADDNSEFKLTMHIFKETEPTIKLLELLMYKKELVWFYPDSEQLPVLNIFKQPAEFFISEISPFYMTQDAWYDAVNITFKSTRQTYYGEDFRLGYGFKYATAPYGVYL